MELGGVHGVDCPLRVARGEAGGEGLEAGVQVVLGRGGVRGGRATGDLGQHRGGLGRRRAGLLPEDRDDGRRPIRERLQLELVEVRHRGVALPAERARHQVSCPKVAHRPYSCMAWVSTSIASRVPVETTQRPLVWMSIIIPSATCRE